MNNSMSNYYFYSVSSSIKAGNKLFFNCSAIWIKSHYEYSINSILIELIFRLVVTHKTTIVKFILMSSYSINLSTNLLILIIYMCRDWLWATVWFCIQKAQFYYYVTIFIFHISSRDCMFKYCSCAKYTRHIVLIFVYTTMGQYFSQENFLTIKILEIHVNK